MDNKVIVERVFQLQTAVQGKNIGTALALRRAIVPLLQYRKPLTSAKPQALLALDGIGPKVVGLIERVIAGESVNAIAASVPSIPTIPQRRAGSGGAAERGNWDGSWDNTVRTVEGD